MMPIQNPISQDSDQPLIGVDSLSIPVAILSIETGQVIYANKLFSKFIPTSVIGQTIKGFFDTTEIRQSVYKKLQQKKRVVYKKLITSGNKVKKYKFTITECNYANKPHLFVAIEQTTKSEENNQPLKNNTEEITIDRAYFMSHLGSVLSSKELYEDNYCLCSIDIDHFKIMNERHGYEGGNYILDETFSVIKSQISSQDVLCRMGNNDYVLILKDTTIEEGVDICDNICIAAKENEYLWNDDFVELTLSIGIVPIKFGEDDVNSCLNAAGVALRTAQDNGRDRVHSSAQEDTMMCANTYKIKYVLVIEDQLKNNAFELYAQPIVELTNTSTFDHYEILLRSFDTLEGEYFSSQELIQAAESFNVITKIDEWVCTNVFEKLQSYLDAGIKLPTISINISGHSIVNSEFEKFIRNLVDKHTIPINRICLEITESVAVKSIARAQKFISNMRALGFKFALDDFGVGYCSFNYLQQLEVDHVKIDGVFVSSMLDNPTQFAMVKAITDVARTMNIKTVAEYVENPEVIKVLSAIGVDYGQGFIFGKPQPIDKYLIE